MAITRKSTMFLSTIAFMTVLLCIAYVHAQVRQRSDMPRLLQNADMVRYFELTDLCLFTDAQYTRHPAVANRHTPFQDYPLSFEHFPSGSLSGPPPRMVIHELD
jgi:hypothetical protein